MQLSRSFSLSLSLLALPLAVACGGEDDGTNNATPTTTTTGVAPVTPPVTPSTTAVTPTDPPPVTPTSTAVTPPVTPPVTPEPTDTWTAVYPILQAKCDNGTCHGPGDPFLPKLIGDDATAKAAATAAVDKIALRTEVGYILPMPPSTSGLELTDAERAAIQTWAASL